jgi:hypothetical protein
MVANLIAGAAFVGLGPTAAFAGASEVTIGVQLAARLEELDIRRR